MSCNCAGYTNAGLMGGAYNDAVLDGGYMLNPTNLNKTYLQTLLSQAESETPGTMDALRRLQAARTRPKKSSVSTLTPAKKRALLAKMSGKGFLAKLIGWAVKGNINRWKWLHQTKKDQNAEIERLKALKAAQGKGVEDIIGAPWLQRPAKNPMVGVNPAGYKKKLEEKLKAWQIGEDINKRRVNLDELIPEDVASMAAKARPTGGVGSTRKRTMGAGKQCMGGSKFKKFLSDLKTLFGTPIMPLNIALLVKKKKREAEIEKLKKEVGEA